MSSRTKEQQFVIRRATRADAAALRTLRSTVGWSAARIEHQLTDPRALILVIEADQDLIGTITLMQTHEDPELAGQDQRAYISDLMVTPRWQRYGFGTALLAAAEEEARVRGYTVVTLTVDETNGGARRLYERSGYHWFKTVRFPWGPGHALAKQLDHGKARARHRDLIR